MKIITADYHRNGVGGEPFYVAIVETKGPEWPKRCLVHRAQGEGRCFVLDLDKAAAGDIAFGSNSWRGDVFAARFDPALDKYIRETSGYAPWE